MTIAAAMAGIARSFSDALGVGYVPGMLRWPGTPATDSGGSIITPGTPENHGCYVQVDSVTEAMRQGEGYRDKDMRLLVLADGLGRAPDTDCTVEVLSGPHAGTWKPVSVSRDPAGIYFECLGRRA